MIIRLNSFAAALRAFRPGFRKTISVVSSAWRISLASLVAGKFIGENALALVGNSYEVTLIFIAFAFGCNIGCSVVVSRFFGAKEYGKVKTAVSTACAASAVLCAAIMAVGMLSCDTLLRLIRTPAEAFADSKLYLDIYIWGLPWCFSITSPPAFSPPWEIPARRFSFCLSLPPLTSGAVCPGAVPG